MHRDPQPVKMFTIAPMYRYGAPGKGRYREHWQASVEAIGSDDPSIDAELIQLYDTLLHRLGVSAYHLELNSIGCRTCRPAYLETLARLARGRTSTGSTPTRGPRSRRARCASSTTTSPSPRRSARRSTRRRRSASRCARSASRISPPCGPTSTRPASPTRSFRRSSAGSTTTPARPGSSSARWTTRTRRSRAAAATTGSSRRSAARRRPGVGFGAGLERLLIAMEDAGVTADAPTIDVFFALDEGAPRQRGGADGSPSCARAGLAADTDYAGRSLKGQLTQAARLGAAATVDRRLRTSAVLRRPGRRTNRSPSPTSSADCPHELARHHVRRAPRGARRLAQDARRLGRRAAATTAASSSSISATAPASPSS